MFLCSCLLLHGFPNTFVRLFTLYCIFGQSFSTSDSDPPKINDDNDYEDDEE